MKKKCLFFLLPFCLLTGCATTAKDDTVNNEQIQSSQEKTYLISEGSVSSDGNIMAPALKTEGLVPIPFYHQQNYDIDFGDAKMEESGNLVTCLSMVFSHFSFMQVPPDLFYAAFSEHINSNGSVDDSIYNAMRKHAPELTTTIKPFNLETASDYIGAGYIVMVRLPHPSVYCKGSTYMLLLCTDGDGLIGVADPDVNNMKKFAKESATGITDIVWYEIAPLVSQIGSNATMYIFGLPEVE